MLYFIKLHEHKISVSEYNSHIKKFYTIKQNGEEWQKYHESDFWQWFKKKIAYDDEPLSFIINADIPISVDTSIKIAEKNAFEEYTKDIVPLFDNFDSLVKIPDFEFNPIEDVIEEISEEKTPVEPPKKNSFAHYAKMKREKS